MSTHESAVGRHASWLELFFDLVAVAAVAQLAHRLHGEVGPSDVGLFVLLYLAVWMCWSAFTLYANVARERTRRRSMLAAMFVIAIMAAAIPEATGPRAVVFIVTYVVVRALGARTWQGTGTHLTAWPSVQGLIGVLPWVASIWVDPPGRYVLWTVGLAIDIVLPLLANAERRVPRFAQRLIEQQAEREGRAAPDMSTLVPRPAELDLPHLAERLGLFLIIVLGEAVLQVVSAAAELPWTAGLIAVALGGFALLAGIWWPMFRYGLVGSAGRMLPVRLAMPLHFLTAAGITALAVGLGGLVAHPVGPAPVADRWLLCGGLAAWGLSGILGAPRAGRTHWLLVAGAPGLVLTLGLGAFGARLPGVALVWLLVVVVGGHLGYGMRLDRRAVTA
ncbi:low temperature requirement protein A [Actinocatenispora rupis]|uniref:Low temperature requirement protein LtrA n=1 Tax=Actinocatenispora rupis TaxID=519421 RepID=A0A8J3NBK9_9ACTN|nr:low temperature requirement protein A [Actinocatenispora rupis]GID13459.1 hypothetical protein Aru02nite_43480 [Actinocatenispora rupis]